MSAAQRLIGAAALCVAILSSATASAQTANQIGQACAQLGQTVMSSVQQEGIIACLPDGGGNLYWQPENGGMARYDNTSSCNVAGILRWNGSAIQFCNGSTWQAVGGIPVSPLYACPFNWSLSEGGNWASFGCNGQLSTASYCQNEV